MTDSSVIASAKAELGILDISKDVLLNTYASKGATLINNYMNVAPVDVTTIYPDALSEYIILRYRKRGNEGMKQYITVEQLNEAHPIDTLNLAVILDIGCRDYQNDDELDKMIADRMTIGKMIEILESKDQCLDIIKRIDLDGWGYEIHLRQIQYYSFSTGELCDALWEAVKEVLKG